MGLLVDALVWLNDPNNWRGPDGIVARTGEHLYLSAAAVGLGCLVAWPLGLWMGHTGRGGGITVMVANVSRGVPTFAMLTIFAVSPLGLSDWSTILALALFAVPPLLANAYLGMRQVDRDVVEAARGMGLSGGQLLWRVELPLALPLVAVGFRTAAVQVVATATLAALVAGGGLGNLITFGLGLQEYELVVAGGILVAALALLVDGCLALVERALTPVSARPAVRRRRRRRLAAAPAR